MSKPGKDEHIKEFLLSPVVRSLYFHCWGSGSAPGWGTKIHQAMWHDKKKKKKNPHKLETHKGSLIRILKLSFVLCQLIIACSFLVKKLFNNPAKCG